MNCGKSTRPMAEWRRKTMNQIDPMDIKKLRNNTLPFIFLPRTLQEATKLIGPGGFKRLCGSSVLNQPVWSQCDGERHWPAPECIYRVNLNYAPQIPEPETIKSFKLPIVYRENYSALMITVQGCNYHYTNAPACVPKEGYRFSEFEYADGTMRPGNVWKKHGETTLPVWAIFRKTK